MLSLFQENTIFLADVKDGRLFGNDSSVLGDNVKEKVLIKWTDGNVNYCMTQDDKVNEREGCIRIHVLGTDSIGQPAWTQVMCTHPSTSDKCMKRDTEADAFHSALKLLLSCRYSEDAQENEFDEDPKTTS